jgi:hypothetical protein
LPEIDGLAARKNQPRKRARTKRRCGFATAVLRPEWLSIDLCPTRYFLGLHRYCLIAHISSHRVTPYRGLPAVVFPIMGL